MAEISPQLLNSQAYDHMASWYLQWVEGQGSSPREKYTLKVLEASPPSPHILELGCGPGVPVTQILSKAGARVVANDISRVQIAMARERCPIGVEFIEGDMADLEFGPGTFDGVTCFYTLFHLPRGEQRAMLAKIYSWLKPEGAFAVNIATFDEEEIFGEMMGHGIFWSSYGVAQSRTMFTDVGFELVSVEEVESGDGELKEEDADYGVKFVWIVAKKPTITLMEPKSIVVQ